MSRILAFDACFKSISVAYAENGNIVKSLQIDSGNSFKDLVPLIKKVAEDGSFSEVILTIGPGSFVGMRIGIATVFGLSKARDIKIFGVTTFDAFLHEAIIANLKEITTLDEVSLILDAKRKGFCYYKKIPIYQYLGNGSRNTLLPTKEGILEIEEALQLSGGFITNIESIKEKGGIYVDYVSAENMLTIPAHLLRKEIKPVYY